MPEPAETPAKPKPEDKTGKPAMAQAEEQIARWREVLDTVRGRADITAKALGAIATTAFAAVGINKIQDLSPTVWSLRTGFWAVLAVLGFLAIATVIAVFVGRLVKVNELVVTSTRASALEDLDPSEQALVSGVFGDTASRHQAPSLRAYEARAGRLDRIAARSTSPRREELQEAAGVIRANVQATLTQAAADVVRQRSARTFRGRSARGWYAAAVIGFLLFAVGTDYLAGDRDRKENVAKARLAGDKSCAEVLKAYSDQSLKVTLPGNRRCRPTTVVSSTVPATSTVPASTALPASTTVAPSTTTPASSPSPARVTLTSLPGVLQDLSARLATCQAAVKFGTAGPRKRQQRRCDRIRELIATAAGGR